MADEYVTTEELKSSKELLGTTFADEDVAIAVEAASRGIDLACKRRFWLDDLSDDETPVPESVRLYTPESWRLLWINDLVTPLSVEIDRDGDGVFEDEWTLGEDFIFQPSNAPEDSKPYEIIRVRKSSGTRLPRGVEDSVKITAQFGWPAVPATVKQATKILAAKLVKRTREAPFGIQMSMDAGVAMRIARNDPDVMFLLDGLERKRPF